MKRCRDREKANAYARAYWRIPENRAKKAAYVRKYRELNREKVNAWARLRGSKLYRSGDKYSLRWYHANKEKASKLHSEWSKNNREKINAYERGRLKDPAWRIRKRISSRIRNALKLKRGQYKTCKTPELIGCSRTVLMQWIEAQFTCGMSWDNYGLFGWHVDHIKPCSRFNLSDPNEQRRCFHYTNLQPLWWRDNISKGDKYDK